MREKCRKFSKFLKYSDYIYQIHMAEIQLFKLTVYLFLDRGREGEGWRETLMCERNIHWLPLAWPQMGTCLKTQACALTGS